MKLTVVNSSSGVIEVRYVRVDGSQHTALINPGKATLPGDVTLLMDHPHIKLYDDQGKPVNQVTGQSVSEPTPSKGAKR